MKKRNSGNIAIIGAGRFGLAVVNQLVAEGVNVMVLDREHEPLATLRDTVSKVLVLDATDIKALKAVDIQSFDTVVVATTDNIDIVASLLEVGVTNVIARARNEIHARVLRQIGVKTIIRPEYEAGIRTALIATNPNFAKYSADMKEIGNNFVIATNKLVNLKYHDLTIRETDFTAKGVSIVLIKRGEKFILPTGTTVLQVNDMITIIGTIDNVSRVFELITSEV
ncbi:potassium channel family protein [Mycoplasmopsis opalescens]|uniref:potassium channel family protein n=1 Tax=Mycoplasmopsis opalescens TaxID=114886 RepID=UPI0004A747DD|nr:TrkA family potassium uptake protein [Mycoplasmopsis opalescens]